MSDDGWDEFRAEIKRLRLQKHEDDLVRLCVPSIRLVPDPASTTKTRLGGVPLAPKEFEWPVANGEPMQFVAHVDLEEIHATKLKGAEVLPERGVLAFFHGYSPSPNGKHTGNAGRVFHFDGDLVETSGPSIPEIRVRLDVQTEELPPYESPFYALMTGRLRDHARGLLEFIESYAQLGVRDEDERPVHRLLGYADPLQSDVYVSTQGNARQVPFERWESLEHLREAARFRLLLQLDSDAARDLLFGDLGVLAYMIHEDDLREQRFDRVWVEWQMH